MPEIVLTCRADAPVEEVWKLLFDPTRYPEWWTGVAHVSAEPGGYTQWLVGWPDRPMPQRMTTDRSCGRVTISCQVNDVEFTWRLAEDGDGTAIEARVSLAEHEAHRARSLERMISSSLPGLAALAAART